MVIIRVLRFHVAISIEMAMFFTIPVKMSNLSLLVVMNLVMDLYPAMIRLSQCHCPGDNK